MAPSDEPDLPPRWHRFGTLLLEAAEGIVYVGIAALLSGTAAILLFVAAGQLVAMVRDPGQNTGIEVLDTLLLLFIIVELLFAVRATLRKRELVAEPFLLVGIIASIKEIVVLSVKAAERDRHRRGVPRQTVGDRRARRSWCCCWASPRCCCGARSANPRRRRTPRATQLTRPTAG